MKVPLRWLQEFIELPTTDPTELSDVLTMLGHEVESFDVLEIGWTDVVVGRVEEITAHPAADKVRVCQVDTGSGAEQIICGAWNFSDGAYVAVARPGAVLPGDFEIGRRSIRGVDSNGMICSESELGLGDDHTGILVLDGEPAPGSSFADLVELPDVVFDLAITNNRPDAMSLVGIARDLAAHFEIDYRIPDRPLKTVSGSPNDQRRHRGSRRLPTIHGPRDPRGRGGEFPALGASSTPEGRHAGDLQHRRRDQLCDAGTRSSSPRLRCRHHLRQSVDGQTS